MRKSKKYMFLAAFMAAFIFRVHAADPVLTILTYPAAITYASNTALWASGTFRVTWQYRTIGPTGNQTYAADISPASGSRTTWTLAGHADTIPTPTTQIYKTQNTSGTIVKAWGLETLTSTNVYSRTFPYNSSTTTTLNGTFWVYFRKTSTTLPGGTYQQTFNVRFWPIVFSASGTPTGSPYTAPFTVSINVPLAATLTITDSAATAPGSANNYNLPAWADLAASSPATQSFRVWVESNYYYKVQVSSLNQGVMKNGDTEYSTDSIGYTLTYDSNPLTLSGGAVDVTPTAQTYNHTNSTNIYYQLSVTPDTLSPPYQLGPGTYSDTLTFSIISA